MLQKDPFNHVNSHMKDDAIAEIGEFTDEVDAPWCGQVVHIRLNASFSLHKKH